jgi:hypothetical protein
MEENVSRTEENVNKMGENIEEDLKKMEEQIKRWDEKLLLMARSEVAGSQARIDLRKRIDDIKAKRAEAQAKFDEFRASGSEKWDSFKAGIDAAWKNLEIAFKEIIKD